MAKSLASSFKAYDYVTDLDGWTYTVRGFCLNPARVVARVNYSPTRRCAQGIEPRLPAGRPAAQPFPEGGADIYLLSCEKIGQHIPRSSIPLGSASNLPPELRYISAYTAKCGDRAYLYGSRCLYLDNERSDWDVLISSKVHPSNFLNGLLRDSPFALRRFSMQEIQRRVNRYAKPKGALAVTELGKILPKTTLYLQANRYEIGLFFTDESESVLPQQALEPPAEAINVMARPLPTAGESFFMPRKLSFYAREVGEFRVTTLLWELAGIDLAPEHELRLSLTHRIAPNHWWIGTSNVLTEASHE